MSYEPGLVPDSGSLRLYLQEELGKIAAAINDMFERVTLYTPAWTATADPSLGNGELSGWYARAGRLCHGGIRLVMGSTTTYGTGTWGFSLPFPPALDVPEFHIGSVARLRDDTANVNFIGAGRISNNSALDLAILAEGAEFVASAIPFTWAQDDQLFVSFTYMAER